MLVIDGSEGEGGGQVLRTSLSLSALTGQPFRIEKIRANRSRPGLRPQHLTAVRAAAAICQAELAGDELDSVLLEFSPQTAPAGGDYRFDVAEASPSGHSAGAVTLAETVVRNRYHTRKDYTAGSLAHHPETSADFHDAVFADEDTDKLLVL